MTDGESIILDSEALLEEVGALDLAEHRNVTDPQQLSDSADVFFITRGKALIREDSVLSSKLDATQTFAEGDSIYLAAALSKRPRHWKFMLPEPLEVVAIGGDVLRKAVMTSSFLINEVIRNSVTRIFDVKQRENATFESRLLSQFRKRALRSRYGAGDCIYRIGDPAKGLYFIERGQVYLTTAKGARFAELGETDFFGETSLLTSDRRGKNIYAKTDCSVLLLDRAAFQSIIEKESALVKLVLINIIQVLEHMNRLRFDHLNSSRFHQSS